ncbi:MAG: RodZ domain-containing protein [Candidatus Omnitrophota bacterium]
MEDSVGRRLKDARQKMGLNYDQVYTDLKIYPDVLRALEEDAIDPNIGDVYIKGFLKKYADFLGFDGDKITSEFLSGAWHGGDRQESFAPAAARTNSIPQFTENPLEKYGRIAVAAGVVLAISLIIFAGSKLTKAAKVSSPMKPAQVENITPMPARQKTEKPKAPPAPVSAARPAMAKMGPLVLKAETIDKVWLRVRSDGKTIFENTLDKGASEIWEAKDELELWVGRGDALKLTLNDAYIGSPGSGSIRSVLITREGMKVRKK